MSDAILPTAIHALWGDGRRQALAGSAEAWVTKDHYCRIGRGPGHQRPLLHGRVEVIN